MSHHKQKEHHIRVFKIAAQSLGFIVCAFFLFFLVGEGIPDIVSGKGKELIYFLPFLLLPIAGYVVSWFREKTGMWMILTGAVLLLVYLLMQNGIKAALIYCLPFLATGILFWLHISKRDSLKKQH